MTCNTFKLKDLSYYFVCAFLHFLVYRFLFFFQLFLNFFKLCLQIFCFNNVLVNLVFLGVAHVL